MIDDVFPDSVRHASSAAENLGALVRVVTPELTIGAASDLLSNLAILTERLVEAVKKSSSGLRRFADSDAIQARSHLHAAASAAAVLACEILLAQKAISNRGFRARG